MDFNFSPEDEAFRAEFRAWLDVNAPKSDAPSSDFMFEAGRNEWQRRVAWYKKLAAGGWTCINWPKEYGGRGASILQTIVYNQELARVGAPVPAIGFGPGLLGPTLMHWGTEEQKKRYIPKIISGEEVWCQGYSEPGSGSDLASLQTRAVEDGDYFVVNGQKVWTSLAQFADYIFLLVRTDPEAPKHKGISYLLVDMHSPGVTVRPLVQMTGAKGFNEVFFEDVRVPKKNLVGEKNQGWQVAITTLMFERSGGGGGDRSNTAIIEELVDLARAVRRDGKPAWERADVRQKIAEFACEAHALKYTGLRQLTRRLKGLPPGPEGSMMKLCSSELNIRIALYAMELLGPYSQFEYQSDYSVDHGKWSFRMLAARGGTIAAGSNQIQHNIIGERVLGLPKG
ncbi:MAG TPA: acyl-CoA dehydrogenase [Candidatus Binataceae bacterium]|nr:acyl-CoA dehydrogenase [Candidatus Binataceae bacterium]